MQQRGALSWRAGFAAVGVAVALVLTPVTFVQAQPIPPTRICCFCSCQTNQLSTCTLLTAPGAVNITFNNNALFSECNTHCANVGCQALGFDICPRNTISPSCTPNPAPTASWPALIGLVLLLSGLGFYRMRQRVGTGPSA